MVIRTVLKELPQSDLGYCQAHEHLFIRKGKSKIVNSALWMDNIKATVRELKTYRSRGGNSIVDAQPLGCGRMTENLIKASQKTGINIIAATGFHKFIFYPSTHWIKSISAGEFTSLLIRELEEGMFVDGDQHFPKKNIEARAGIIKTAYDASDRKNKQRYKKLLKAAARASRYTGIPLMCHTEKGKGALEVIELFQSEGVSCDSIIICHVDRRIDNLNYHIQIAESGVYLDYDTIGRFKYHSDEKEVELIIKMIHEGYIDSLLLALDTTRERMKNYDGEIGLDYILRKFKPFLRNYGLNQQHLNKITEKNPARALLIKNRTEKK